MNINCGQIFLNDVNVALHSKKKIFDKLFSHRIRKENKVIILLDEKLYYEASQKIEKIASIQMFSHEVQMFGTKFRGTSLK